MKALEKRTTTTTSHSTSTPFFNKTAQVRDTDTGGLMTRHLTSQNDVKNLGKEVASPTRTTDYFFGGKDTFFK